MASFFIRYIFSKRRFQMLGRFCQVWLIMCCGTFSQKFFQDFSKRFGQFYFSEHGMLAVYVCCCVPHKHVACHLVACLHAPNMGCSEYFRPPYVLQINACASLRICMWWRLSWGRGIEKLFLRKSPTTWFLDPKIPPGSTFSIQASRHGK